LELERTALRDFGLKVTSKASPLCFRARVTTEGVALSVVAAEMRAIELDALHGGIGCGLGGA